MKGENRSQEGTTMKTRQISKQSTQKALTRYTEERPAERKKRAPDQGMRIRLLLLLLGSLAILFVLHLIVAYAQSPAAQPTTCDQLMASTDYTQAVDLQPDNQVMAAVQMVNELDNGAPA